MTTNHRQPQFKFDADSRTHLQQMEVMTIANVIDRFLSGGYPDFVPSCSRATLSELITGKRSGMYGYNKYEDVRISFSSITSRYNHEVLNFTERSRGVYHVNVPKTQQLFDAIRNALQVLKEIWELLYSLSPDSKWNLSSLLESMVGKLGLPEGSYKRTSSEENFIREGLEGSYEDKKHWPIEGIVGIRDRHQIGTIVVDEFMTIDPECKYIVILNECHVVFCMDF